MGLMSKAITIFTTAMMSGCVQVGSTDPVVVSPTLPNAHFCEAGSEVNREVQSAPSRRLAKIATKTRNAAVMIHHIDGSRRGSGVYMSYDNHHLVLTSAHVVEGGPPIVRVTTHTGESVVAPVIVAALSHTEDYAVLLIEEPLSSATAMPLKIRQNSRGGIVGESIVYSGSPGHHELLTLYGNVSGVAANENLIVHSYAWMGASGSGVFDDRGNLVGILRAIDVNDGIVVPQLNEDMVWVAPLTSIDLQRLSLVLEIYDLASEVDELNMPQR